LAIKNISSNKCPQSTHNLKGNNIKQKSTAGYNYPFSAYAINNLILILMLNC